MSQVPDFKSLQDFVIDECQELQALPDFNVTRVKAYINRGQQDFVRRTKCLRKLYQITTVASQLAYSLNAKIYHIEHVRYVTDSSTEVGRVLKPYPGGYERLPKTILTGTPDFYWLRYAHNYNSSEVGTWPVVADASETLDVFAWYFPDDLSANADQSDIKESWHDAMSHYATWRLCSIYSHKSKAIRQKAIDNKLYYEQMVDDGLAAFMMDSEDQPQEILDVYGQNELYIL